MDSFLFCLLLVSAIALGGRDQRLVAQLSDALADTSAPLIRRPVPLLALGLVCAAVSAGVMAYAGLSLASLLPRRAEQMLVAFALGLAAFELGWPVRMKPAKEPTRSLGAIGLVLLWRQLGDGARFVIFAFAAGAPYPLTAFVGGALGGSAALGLGWWLGQEQLARWPLALIRRTLAMCLVVAALFIGLNARYSVY
ncbi:MAG: hypothetical protein AAFZ11_03470 [Pseudomonadota bacterium]